MTRLTLAGAIFLTIIAIMPDVLLFELDVPPRIAYFFGGTGMLITVGVILDTMRQIETFLLQRHYDGFLKKGRIRARSTIGQRGVGRGRRATNRSCNSLRLWLVILLIGIDCLGLSATSLFNSLLRSRWPEHPRPLFAFRPSGQSEVPSPRFSPIFALRT